MGLLLLLEQQQQQQLLLQLHLCLYGCCSKRQFFKMAFEE